MEATVVMPKIKSRAFGKDIYLLGEDKNGLRYWLEAPKWECDWYWGFGYIETYTNNKCPSKSKDIESHQHANEFMFKYAGKGSVSKSILVKRTFTDDAGWELSDLFKQFYLLREMAEYCKCGYSYISKPKIELFLRPELVKEINEKRIPLITKRILEILSPNTT